MKERTSMQVMQQLPAEYLYRGPESAAPFTFSQIEEMIFQNDYAVLPVVGDCMEAFGIDGGDQVAVCFTRFPRPPKYKCKHGFDRRDACLC